MDKQYGSAPLTVQFEDRSSSEAIFWLWRFGDGETTNVQNPTHTYEQEGKYTVILSVWDEDSTKSITAAEIRAVGFGVCDTLNYKIPGFYYLYQIPEPATGYLSGNNSRGDLSKASYFSVTEEKGMLMGGLFFFAHKSTNFTSDPPVVFKAWDNDGYANSPGTLLDSTSVLMSEILIDESGTGIYPATIAFFDNWVTIDHDFYMGVELPQTAGDTVALFTNKIDATTNGNGWEQLASGEWQTYKQGHPGYDIDNAMYPMICQTTGIDNFILEQNIIVYPIPAKDKIYISIFDNNIKDVKLSIVDISGRLVLESQSDISSGSSIDVSNLSEGLYVLRLHTHEGVFNRKIMIK